MNGTAQRLTKHIWHASGRAKTVCTSAVIAYFWISPESYHYSSRWEDIARIFRTHGFSFRSRMSKVGKGRSVGQARKRIAAAASKDPAGTMYIIGVEGHVLLVDGSGRTVVDTAPRKRDRRIVTEVAAIFPKGRN